MKLNEVLMHKIDGNEVFFCYTLSGPDKNIFFSWNGRCNIIIRKKSI